MDNLNLYEFLVESELQQYYHDIKNTLKIEKTSQLKHTSDDALLLLGMTVPELRRLRKLFQKKYSGTYLTKIKNLLKHSSSSSNSGRQYENYATHFYNPRSTAKNRPYQSGDKHGDYEYLSEASDTTLVCSKDVSYKKLPESQLPSKHIISADAITINKQLGVGEFGVVQQGVWTNNGERIQVAIKCLSRERMQSNPIEFLKEASIMHSIDHKQIVQLYGVVLDTQSLMLVTELAPLRSLLECLKEPALRSSFPVLTLCDFALQICDGMQYLESKRLIHRDLAARNILVFSKFQVKISDFGLSRALGQGKDYYQTNFNVNLKLPIAWCAPESISFLKFTSASDVWAYAVTLWEMFSYGFQPWAALTGQQIIEAIDQPNFQRLERPDCCPNDYYLMMLSCWDHDPNKRPKFANLFYSILPDCRPEQVQAIANYEATNCSPKMLSLHVSDIITVLDKNSNSPYWKGVLNNGKSGLFDPKQVVAYLGSDLPNSKSFSTTSLFRSSGRFLRHDFKFSSMNRKKPKRKAISSPKSDLKHTCHVGFDGAYFGDLTFLGYPSDQIADIPKQVVTPYKPHDDVPVRQIENPIARQIEPRANLEVDPDHEYHEIDSDNASTISEPDNTNIDADDQYFLTPPHSTDTDCFDFGPSLVSEMESVFKSFKFPSISKTISEEHKDFKSKILGKSKKKDLGGMKPITAKDEKLLKAVFALANDFSACVLEANDPRKAKPDNETANVTPGSPTKRKFSFKLPSVLSKSVSKSEERRNFSEEVRAIPNIETSLTDSEQLAYEMLVEKASPSSSISNIDSYLMCQSNSFDSDESSFERNPLKIIRSGSVPIAKPRIKPSSSAIPIDLITANSPPPPLPPKTITITDPEALLRGRHVRKYPLIIPASHNVQRTLRDVSFEKHLTRSRSRSRSRSGSSSSSGSGSLNVRQSRDDHLEFEAKIDQQLEILEQLDIDSGEECVDQLPISSLNRKKDEDAVSCEDLLEFANSKPTPRERGVDSDEMRILIKVFSGQQIDHNECLAILEFSNWNVHKSIKLVKLKKMLNNVDPNISLAKLSQVLDNAHWDLIKAFDSIKNGDETTIVHL